MDDKHQNFTLDIQETKIKSNILHFSILPPWERKKTGFSKIAKVCRCNISGLWQTLLSVTTQNECAQNIFPCIFSATSVMSLIWITYFAICPAPKYSTACYLRAVQTTSIWVASKKTSHHIFLEPQKYANRQQHNLSYILRSGLTCRRSEKYIFGILEHP